MPHWHLKRRYVNRPIVYDGRSMCAVLFSIISYC